ncbi:MAG: PhnD/SsuA/transferrin family substrate-binding protein [Gemmatales bacterium]
MISRRSFLGSLTAALVASKIDARWLEKIYRVGISDSMLPNDMNDSMSTLFESPGKPKCKFESGSPDTVVKRLKDEHTNLCVLEGVEYAWLKAANPELVPLVTAFTTDVKMKGCIVVVDDNPAKTLLDLRGKSLCQSERLPHHTYVYLHHALEKSGAKPKGFFKATNTPANSDEGIESVIEGKADAILLDFDSWKVYQERKPERSKKLRIIDQSCDFPTSVVLYQKGCWGKAEILILELALCSAHEKPYSRQLFNCWGISKFVPCGARYRRITDNILAEIPRPIIPVEFTSQGK